MLFALLPLHAVSLLASTSLGAERPAIAQEASLESDTVAVTLYDENHPETVTLQIGRDGSMDPDTTQELEYLFRCKRTELHRHMNPEMLSMLADVSAHFGGKSITFVSAYRTGSMERDTSPHKAGRALDFRIPGVSTIDIRDYMWKYYDHVGVGYYPNENFVHLDHRQDDIAWTFLNGTEHYNPSWATRIREELKLDTQHSTVGL
jgi:uncharacterized protein YcbK (DUF882 family)